MSEAGQDKRQEKYQRELTEEDLRRIAQYAGLDDLRELVATLKELVVSLGGTADPSAAGAYAEALPTGIAGSLRTAVGSLRTAAGSLRGAAGSVRGAAGSVRTVATELRGPAPGAGPATADAPG